MFFGVDSLFVTNNYNMYISGNKTLNKCMHYIRLLGLKTHYKCLIIEIFILKITGHWHWATLFINLHVKSHIFLGRLIEFVTHSTIYIY